MTSFVFYLLYFFFIFRYGVRSAPGSKNCSGFCPGGEFFNSTACATCPVGHFCPANSSSSPLPCPMGTFNGDVGKSSYGDCGSCGSGSYALVKGSEVCSVCPRGYKCVDPKISPVKCFDGQYTAAAGSSVCLDCPLGKYCPNVALEPLQCEIGTYSQGGRVIACSVCPEGYYNTAVEQSSCSKCIAGEACTRGGNVQCPRGSISFAGATTCYKCKEGRYTTAPGDTVCLECPAGSFCLDSSKDPDDCPVGTYSPEGSIRCINCPPGMYNDDTGRINCTTCPAGFSCNDISATPTACENGTYSLEGMDHCIECPPGFYCASPSSGPWPCSEGTYSPGGIITECAACDDGYYADQEKLSFCFPCGVGNDCSNKASAPTPCQEGWYSDDIATACQQCAAGTYSHSGMGYCLSCPAGFYCETGSSSPKRCDGEGQYSGIKADSCSMCTSGFHSSLDHSSCLPCTAGRECSDPSVGEVDCNVGSYSEAQATYCESCLPGWVCSDPSLLPQRCLSGYSTLNSTECILCPEGFSCLDPSEDPVACGSGEISPRGEDKCFTCSNAENCDNDSNVIKCQLGYYRKDPGDTICTICDAGSKCVSGLDPIVCAAGYYSVAGEYTCHECPPGFSCANTDELPTTCLDGYYSTGFQVGCTQCPAGFICPQKDKKTLIPCPAGTYSDAGSITCTECPVGSECPDPTNSGLNAACGSGYVSFGRQVKCKKCERGYYCPDSSTELPCPAGYTSQQTGQDACDICPVGKYCPDRVHVIPCANGQYALDQGSVQCDDCPAGSFCDGATAVTCPLGFYCPANSPLKIPCKPGTIGVNTGKSTQDEACNLCPEAFYCALSMSSTAQVKGDCPEGYYCPDGTKYATEFPCPAGTYNDLESKVKVEDCKPCPAGYYCLEGTNLPRRCHVGYFCPEGTRYQKEFPCPAGSYRSDPIADSQSDCLECGVGRYCKEGSFVEEECDFGTFNPNTGMEKSGDCFHCPLGFYCPHRGMSDYSAFPCPRGHYCGNGTVTPTPCPVGTFNDLEQLTRREDCKICIEGYACLEGTGTIDSDEDRSNFLRMIPCSQGYFCPGAVDGSGDTLESYTGVYAISPTEFPCEAGAFNPFIGQKDCISCPGGSYCTGGMSRPTGKCEPGYYCPSGSKIKMSYPCPNGTYSGSDSLDDSSQCVDCPKGSYCSLHSVTPIPCPAGSYANTLNTKGRGPSSDLGSGQCLFCTEGYYCPEETVDPIECGAGYYSESGAEECLICQSGYYCSAVDTSKVQMLANPCPDEMFCGNGTDHVPSLGTDACPKGKYCPAATSVALNCSLGRYNNETGKKLDSECTICPAGSYCEEGSIVPSGLCAPGHFCVEGSNGPTQEPCPIRTYRDTEEGASVGDCHDCPEGYFCPVKTIDPIDCTEGNYCPASSFEPTPCPIGKYGNGRNLKNVGECMICPPGVFCDTLGATYPTGPCDPGFYCLEGATTAQPVDGPTGGLCPKGGYCELGSKFPEPCEPGTFNNRTGGDNKYEDCEPCTRGYFCAGSNSPFPSGECDPGFYCTSGSAISQQYETPPGYFSPAGSYAPEICPPGTFNHEPKQSVCTNCFEGYYCPVSGMQTQYPCPRGKYCSERTVIPDDCPKGTFSPSIGLKNTTECLPCTPGEYCEVVGSETTTGPCSPGYFCTGGAIERNPITQSYGDECPIGYYCTNGTSSPQPCPPGSYGPSKGLGSLGECESCPAGKYCPLSAMLLVDLSGTNYDCQAGYFCTGGSTVPSQSKCTAGHFCVSGSSIEEPCVDGEYTTLEGSEACNDCLPGYYCPTGDDIRVCERGNFCPTRSKVQQFCPTGTFSNRTGISSADQCFLCSGGMYCDLGGDSISGLTEPSGECNPGYYCTRGATTNVGDVTVGGIGGICPQGSFCPTGSTSPVKCPIGKFLGVQGKDELSDCVSCSAGQYCSGTGLTTESGDCSPGFYCISDAKTPTPTDGTTGDICSEGNYCLAGDSLPRGCEPGTFQPSKGASSCVDCPSGTYCVGNNTIPELCEKGYFCPEKTTSLSNDLKCPEGSFSDVKGLQNYTQCRRCLEKEYCDDIGLISPSGDCSAGYYCLSGAKNNVGESGILGGEGYKCPAGYFCEQGSSVPTPCRVGTFNPDEYATDDSFCKICTPGKYCNSIALTEVSGNCSAGFFCTEGAVSPTPTDGVTGDICPKGKFCEMNTITPQNCYHGYHSPEEGNSDCDVCPEGYYCVSGVDDPIICPKTYICTGNSILAIMQNVERCPKGSFSNRTGLYDANQCDLCLPGKVCSVSGLLENDKECLEGNFCPLGAVHQNGSIGVLGGIEGGECPKGNFCPTGSEYPTPCPPGRFNPETGKISFLDCLSCPEGFYCEGTGLSNYTGVCGEGFYCPPGQSTQYPDDFKCTVGHFCLENFVAPEICEDGFYNPHIGQNLCLECEEGFFCENGMKYICPVGFFCPSGTADPEKCLDGTYGLTAGLFSSADCLSCPAGKYCVNGNITDDCDAGHICYYGNSVPDPSNDLPKGDLCPLGFYCEAGVENPVACSNNKFGLTIGGRNSTVCDSCPAGYHCVEGITTPRPCAVGFYCEEGENPAPCGIGTYNPREFRSDISQCLPCPAGFYCDEEGLAIYKKECPEGYFCEEGSSSVYRCPNGTYNIQTKGESLADCLECPGGYYCDDANIYPVECRGGYFCSNGSSFETRCPASSHCPTRTEIPIVCPPSYYCPEDSVYPTLCDIAHYCPGNTSVPISCPDGYEFFQTSTRDTVDSACVICSPGWYGSADHMYCSKCSEGFYCREWGSFSPTPVDGKCRQGYYCPEGSSEEIICPAGTHQDKEGARNCTECTEGYYTNLPGSVTCKSCGFSSKSNAENTNCECVGQFRSYQLRSKACLCQSGYVYYDGLTVSTNDSVADCQSIIFERCYSDQKRNVYGNCVAEDDTACEHFCVLGNRKGRITTELGICECEQLVNENEICDEECREQQGKMWLVPGNGNQSMSFHYKKNGADNELDFSSSKIYGDFHCVNEDGCELNPLVMDLLNGFYGMYDPPQEYFQDALNGTTSRRGVADYAINGIYQPLICINYGNGVFWDISAGNYPVYKKDTLVNTNQNFDYSPFIDLSYKLQSGEDITSFFYMFADAGVYVFGDSVDLEKYIIVRVMNTDEKCEDNVNFKSLTESSIVTLGIKVREDVLYVPDMYLVLLLLLFIAVFVALLIFIIYVFRTKKWKISGTSVETAKDYLDRDLIRSKGGVFREKELLWASLSKEEEEMDLEKQKEIEKKLTEEQIKRKRERENFGTETFKLKWKEFSEELITDIKSHREKYISKYQSVLNETDMVKKLLGKDETKTPDILVEVEEHFNKLDETFKDLTANKVGIDEKSIVKMMDEIESKLTLLKKVKESKEVKVVDYSSLDNLDYKKVMEMEKRDSRSRDELISAYRGFSKRLEALQFNLKENENSPNVMKRLYHNFTKFYKNATKEMSKKLEMLSSSRDRINNVVKKTEKTYNLQDAKHLESTFFEMLDDNIVYFLKKHTDLRMENGNIVNKSKDDAKKTGLFARLFKKKEVSDSGTDNDVSGTDNDVEEEGEEY